jgi:hypothetical protein
MPMNLRLKSWYKYWPIAISIIVPFLGFAKFLLGNQALYWGTPLFQFYPWQIYTLQLLQNQQIPLWNHLNGMGAPLLANYQLAFFYPPSWLIYIAGSIWGTSGIIWGDHFLLYLHIVWACVGMAMLARKLGITPIGQVISGLAFGMSSYLLTRLGFFPIIFTIAWLPWVVISCDQLTGLSLRDYLKKAPVYIPLIFCMILLTGHAQSAWYCLLLGFCWGLYRSAGKNGWRTAFSFGIVFIVSIILATGLAAIQLIPTAEFLSQSQRATQVGYAYAMTYSLWPWKLIGLLFPDFFGNPMSGNYWGYATYWEDSIYIGVFPLLLAGIGLINHVKRLRDKENSSKIAILLFGVIAVGLVFALGKNTPLYPFLYQHIPTFSMFQAPARWLIWVVFGLAMLSGMGMDALTIPIGKSLYWCRLATAGAFAITIGAFLAWMMLGNIQPTFIRATALGGVWLCLSGLLILFQPDPGEQRRRIWAGVIIAFVSMDLLLFASAANPTQPKGIISGQTQKEKNAASFPGRSYISLDDEYQIKFGRILRFQDYRPLVDPANLVLLPLPNLNLLSNTEMVNNFDPLVPERYYRLMDELKYVVTNPEMQVMKDMAVSHIYRLNSSPADGFDIVSIDSYAYATWFACSQYASSKIEAWVLYSASFLQNGMNRKIIIEDADAKVSNQPCDTAGKVHEIMIKRKNQDIVIATSTDADGWLRISQTWYPGWEATMDGNRIKLYPSDFIFTGLWLPSGNHEIILKYNPSSFRYGYGITFFGILIVISWWGWAKRKAIISK